MSKLKDILALDDPATWPKHIIKQLKTNKIRRLLKDHNSFDYPVRISNNFDIRSIFVDVQEHAEAVGVIGYHCTKQLPEKPFKKIGLRLLNIEQHHREFLEYIRDKVKPSLYKHIEKALCEWRHCQHRRERQLHFCLTPNQIIEPYGGAEDFFTYFGGEAIYMQFVHHIKTKIIEVERLLEGLGEPVVVKTKLTVSHLQLSPDSLGRCLVGYYAQSINKEFIFQDPAVYSKRDILPCDILEVVPHKIFVASVKHKISAKKRKLSNQQTRNSANTKLDN
jgi:hypothetical protein